MTTVPKTQRSLVQFAKDKRRENCSVCKLSDEVRRQMREASDKKIPRRVVKEWLETEHSKKLTDTEMTTHSSGHHDE